MSTISLSRRPARATLNTRPDSAKPTRRLHRAALAWLLLFTFLPLGEFSQRALAQSRITRIEQPLGVHHGARNGLGGGPIYTLTVGRDGRIFTVDGGRLFAFNPPSRVGGLASQIGGLSEGRWTSIEAPTGSELNSRLLASNGDSLLWVEPNRLTAHNLADNNLILFEDQPIRHLGKAARGGSAFLAFDTALMLVQDTIKVWDISSLLLGANLPLEPSVITWSVAVDDARNTIAVGLRGSDPRGLRMRPAGGSGLDIEYLSPQDGHRDWTPRNVTAVHFDALGRLWFATPQGLGVYDPSEQRYRLWGRDEGLPWSEITAITSKPDVTAPGRSIWIGTTRGLIHLRPDMDAPENSIWEVRQGPRWLPNDKVNALTFDKKGDLWVATDRGIGQLAFVPTTLSEKARYFDEQIDAHHKRTEYGYVDALHLVAPGNRENATLRDSDNDGLWTSMYGAAQVFAWATSQDPAAKQRADQAFRAVSFLSEVTQGGSPAAQPGFVARSILPTSGPDPNEGQAMRDDQIRRRDKKWKTLTPRWGTSADGQWYWKADTSSDELDGHFFFYGLYYDLVAGPAERPAVRQTVHRIVDHLLRNDFALVDHDGQPTRWAVFGPNALQGDPSWWEEVGLNSMSVLSYLRVAEHVSETEEQKAPYREAARRLMEQHGYSASARHPKVHEGPGTGNQSDNEMALMNLYNLVRYEQDPQLLSQWAHTLQRYWRLVEPERNPLFHYLFAGALKDRGIRYTDAYDDYVVQPEGREWKRDSVETLVRYPLDRTDWPLTNAHRHDVVPLRTSTEERPRGHRRDGKVLPIDERYVGHWNHDPWALEFSGQGTRVGDGASFLLPYYLGLYYRFID